MDFNKAIRKIQSQSRATNSGAVINLVDTITEQLVILKSRITKVEDEICYTQNAEQKVLEKSGTVSAEESASEKQTSPDGPNGPNQLSGPTTDKNEDSAQGRTKKKLKKRAPKDGD